MRDEISAQVVARFDGVVVISEVGIILIGLAPHEPLKALEAPV